MEPLVFAISHVYLLFILRSLYIVILLGARVNWCKDFERDINISYQKFMSLDYVDRIDPINEVSAKILTKNMEHLKELLLEVSNYKVFTKALDITTWKPSSLFLEVKPIPMEVPFSKRRKEERNELK